MMMKKKLSALLAFAAVTCMGIVPAFAISMQDAEQIVKNEYPGAVIHRVERDYDDGRRVYEIDFHSDSVWEGDLTIDAETGRILERDIDNDRDRDCNRRHRHNRHCSDW